MPIGRRTVLGGLVASAAAGLAAWPLLSQQPARDRIPPTPGEEKLIAQLGVPVVKVPGAAALATWEQMRAGGDGYPVILGDVSALADIVGSMDFFADNPAGSSRETIIAEGSALDFPAVIHALRKEERDRFRADYPEYAEEIDDDTVDYGPWPRVAPESPGLTVHADVLSGKPFDSVFIASVPSPHGWHVPAWFHWGGWNANPLPKYHVAALRTWETRYGAELVGMDAGTLNLRVKRRPETRAEALALAYAQYDYCNDIVDQGVGTIANHAASLMTSDWWYFWWD